MTQAVGQTEGAGCPHKVFPGHRAKGTTTFIDSREYGRVAKQQDLQQKC